jgi:type IV pilus assembly protein PilV
MKPLPHPGSNQRGVTLLEALLGILVFSIGILAVVGMQVVAIKTVAESKYRMDASFLANEIIGEMWANRTNLASYNYGGGTAPAVLTTWVAKVNNTLPGVAANPPTINVAAGNVVTVTIFWQHAEEASLNQPPPPHSYTAIASINCC